MTTNIVCRDGSWIDKVFYAGNDFFQYLSYLHRPFATGMFMLFDRKKFWELGGFHEQILFAEDYRLSQKVERKRFAIVRGGVYTTNRRFKRMGHLKVGWLFLKTAMNFWNEKYFLRDHKYWANEADSLPAPRTCVTRRPWNSYDQWWRRRSQVLVKSGTRRS